MQRGWIGSIGQPSWSLFFVVVPLLPNKVKAVLSGRFVDLSIVPFIVLSLIFTYYSLLLSLICPM